MIIVFIFFALVVSIFLISIQETKNNYTSISFEDPQVNDEDKSILHSSASEVWSDVWGYSGTYKFERGNDIVVDSEGNSYIIGRQSETLLSTYDILLIKYNSTGHYEWNITWGIDDNYEYANALAIDSEGNLYVAGRMYADMLLIKFNSSGVEQWNVTWGNSFFEDEAYDIDLDSEGNIYLAGAMEYDGGFDDYYDLALVKFNNTGHEKWNITYRSFPYNNYGLAVKVDLADYVYVAGRVETTDAYTDKAYIAKYNSSGQKEWDHEWGTYTFPYHDEYYNDVAIDSYGNVYAAGVSTTGASNILLVKYNGSNGNQLWNKTWSGGMDVSGNGIIIDPFDNLYIVGSKIALGPAYDDVILVHFNSSGVYKWYELWGSVRREYGNGIFMDSLFNIYLTGYRDQAPIDNEEDLLIIKYTLTPGTFSLSSNADSNNIDYDGKFNLTWTAAGEANDYSLYWSDRYFDKPNSSVELIKSGNTNRTYTINVQSNGTYFFRVWAYNNYGNKSSNCLFIEVSLDKPSTFTIYTNADPIDDDGIFDITWDECLGAKNYSIFYSVEYIIEVNSSHYPPIYEGLTLLGQQISGLFAGDHYFKVVAYNDYGNRTSDNYIHVYVQYLPGEFILMQPHEPVYEDIGFNLTWKQSYGSDYYYLYQASHNITEFNETVFRYSVTFYTNKCAITDLSVGVYYFKVVAFNTNGNYTSNCIMVTILPSSGGSSPPDDDDDDDDDDNSPAIPGYNYLIIIGIICFVSNVLLIKNKRKVK